MTTLVWFRQDLRLSDNPALTAAIDTGKPVIPVFIFAPDEEGSWSFGAATRWWLHGSLAALGDELKMRGSRLSVMAGDSSLSVLLRLAHECRATRIVWNRRYEPAAIERDREVKTALRADGIECESYNAALLNEPWTVKTKNGGPFQVFTPFWKQCKSLQAAQAPLLATAAPASILPPGRWPESSPLKSLQLLPHVDWAGGMRSAWTPGSRGAHAQLQRFLGDAFDHYGTQRDEPGVQGTSRLSPHLHFGEIGPHEIWHATQQFAHARGQDASWVDSQFLTEIGWREFAHHLLYHFPTTPEKPLRSQFARFPWKPDARAFDAWKRGMTGFPIVDAGMRQLWQSGWMHNRVRMIAASFLVKDLLISWQEGSRWFWDTLVDADLASNTLGWQWVAGCGADASPYFRIFNPMTQGQKFDPEGLYIRQWIPELSALPNQWIHEPWSAPDAVLEGAKLVLGEHYPRPIVDHAVARERALAALATIKSGSD